MKLLHIIASPRERSRSRTRAARFLKALRSKYPDLEIEDLNLLTASLPEVIEGTAEAKKPWYKVESLTVHASCAGKKSEATRSISWRPIFT